MSRPPELPRSFRWGSVSALGVRAVEDAASSRRSLLADDCCGFQGFYLVALKQQNAADFLWLQSFAAGLKAAALRARVCGAA